MSFLGGLLVVIVPLGLVVLIGRPFRDVTRKRLERFARRQQLVITARNGQRVISYLATTRRWRAGGILVALAVVGEYDYQTSRHFDFNAVAGFAGWFIGAIVAEWRVSTGRRDGVRRAASLVPRRLTDYVERWLPPAVVAALLLTAGLEVVLFVTHPGSRATEGVLLAVTVVVGAAVIEVSRKVLSRPQSLGVEDVATDDAMRSRSLHVLLGSAIALAAFLLGGAKTVLDTRTVESWSNGLGLVAVVMLIAGVIAATATFSPGERVRAGRATVSS
jgi:hypothetical protein